MTLAPDEDPLRRDWPLVAVSALVFCALWFWQARASDGFLEADACTHYLIARFAFAEPYRFADVWGRPLKTLLNALPALAMGRIGVRGMSLALALGTAFVAMILARDLRMRRPGLAFLFTLSLPLVFLHSFSELTELPFAFALSLAYVAYTKRHWRTFAFLAGLLPLARPEGFPLLALAGVTFLVIAARGRAGTLPRNLTAIALFPLGLVLWSIAGWATSGHDGSVLSWIPRHWPYAGDSVYTQNLSLWTKVFHLFKFTLSLPAITGPALFPAFLIGLAVAAKRRHLSLLAIPAIVLVGHSLLYFLGKMASNGELRYMLVAAPFWAVLCALGWEAAATALARPMAESARFACYAAILPLLVSLRVYNVLPVSFDDSWLTTRQIALWADRYGHLAHRPAIMAAHPGIYYFLDRSNNDPVRSREFTVENVAHPPPGTILLYDPIYSRFNASRSRRVDGPEDIERAGWIPYPHPLPDGWRAYLSPQ
jgi:hypothetical protein